MSGFVVLTASGGVSDANVGLVRDAIGATGSSMRQSENAVEIPVVAPPELPEIDGVDVNYIDARHREPGLFLADMDSTMITVECIDELADFAGVKDQVAGITERAMRGELDFEAALHERVGLLRGVSADDIETCYRTRVSLTPGADILVRTLTARDVYTCLVSGGFTVFTSRIAARCGFDMHRANTLLDNKGRLTGEVGKPIVHSGTKLATLRELADARSLPRERIIAIGDGANDAPMIEAAGTGIAYRAKPILRQAANTRLDHSDLTAVLSILGIAESEWVSPAL